MAEIGKRPRRVDEFSRQELIDLGTGLGVSDVGSINRSNTAIAGAKEAQRLFEEGTAAITATAQEESARQIRIKQQKRGRASTIVGGRQGDTSQLSLSRRTLLGV